MFAVYRFFTDYAPGRREIEHVNPVTGETEVKRRADNTTREIHKVEYGPLGAADRSRTVAVVSHLKPKLQPGIDVQPGSALEQAMVKWQFIEPLYKKWLEGQEATPDGTPLAAWSGVGPEQAEGLRRKEIYTVEQLANLSDTHLMQYGIQGLRVLRDNAKRFVAAFDTARVEEELRQKDIQIDGLTEQMRAMGAQMEQMQRDMERMRVAPPSVQTQAGNDDPGNDDAFGGVDDNDATDAVPVTTPVRQPRRGGRAR